MIGQTISHYKILEELGGGGMGVVYKAEDTKLKRSVALKFLPPELTRDKDAKTRFIHEARAASALQHHNICTIHEIDETPDGRMFISMDCYEGETLKERIAGGPLPVEEALDIAIQVAEGLSKAHEAGMVHRDIKPANIVITNDGIVKILDFGLAKLAGQTKVTKTGTTVGTVAYMSPEQATGSEVDHRSDIWSLGAVLYEMLAGATPFRGDHEAAVLYSIANTEPKTITQYRSDLPGDLQIILDRTLRKNPGKRYQSVAELDADLKRLRMVRSGDGSSVSYAKTIRRRMPIVSIAAIIVIAVATVIALKQPWRSSTTGEISLAVVDFRTVGGTDEASVSAGMAILLNTGLVEHNPCHIISPQYLHEIHRRLFGTTGAPIGEDEALQVARMSGATMLLSGQVMAASGTPFVAWQLVDSKSGRILGAERVQGKDLLQLADRIIAGVLPLLGEEAKVDEIRPSRSISDLTTDSPYAYDHYVAGLLALERGGKESARPEFERAVELDSTFALAHYELCRLHFTIGFNQQMGPTRDHAEQAWRHRAHLNLKDRMRLEALRQRIEFQLDDAVATYNEMLARWPDDKILLKDLIALLHFHWRFEEAWNVTRQALSLYPDEWTFVGARANLLGLFGRGREALNLLMTYAEDHPENAQAWYEVGQRYYELSLPDSAEVFLHRALKLEPNYATLSRFLSYCDYLRGNIDSAIVNHERILERDDLTDAQRRRILTGVSNVPDLALLHAECGRFQKAFDCIDQAKKYASGAEDEVSIDYARARLLLGLGRSKEALHWGRAVLLRTDQDRLHGIAYLTIARALARLDSVDAAREALARARDIQLRLGIPDNMGKVIEAEIALAENNPHTALEALRDHKRLFGEVAWGGLNDIEQRELLAEAYRMAGRLEEAAKVHEEMARIYGGHALSHYALGKIYQEMGRTAEAKREFTRFLEMWADADEGLPQLEDARQQLAELQQSFNSI